MFLVYDNTSIAKKLVFLSASLVIVLSKRCVSCLNEKEENVAKYVSTT